MISLPRRGGPEVPGSVVIPCDLVDPADLASVGARVAAHTGRIDLLVHNAGVHARSPQPGLSRTVRLGELDGADLLSMFAVNTVGPLLLTQALRPLLGAGSRVVHLGSRQSACSLPSKAGNHGYVASKAALGRLTRSLAEELRPAGIAVICVSPGSVDTEMGQRTVGGETPERSAEAAALALLALAESVEMGQSGGFFDLSGRSHPW